MVPLPSMHLRKPFQAFTRLFLEDGCGPTDLEEKLYLSRQMKDVNQ